MKKKTAVLFVCLGNICRSPTAHGVFETLVHRAGLASAIDVDSAGNGRLAYRSRAGQTHDAGCSDEGL